MSQLLFFFQAGILCHDFSSRPLLAALVERETPWSVTTCRARLLEDNSAPMLGPTRVEHITTALELHYCDVSIKLHLKACL